LKLNYDKLLSNFAFNCNLRHYIEGTYAVRLRVDTLVGWCRLTLL